VLRIKDGTFCDVDADVTGRKFSLEVRHNSLQKMLDSDEAKEFAGSTDLADEGSTLADSTAPEDDQDAGVGLMPAMSEKERRKLEKKSRHVHFAVMKIENDESNSMASSKSGKKSSQVGAVLFRDLFSLQIFILILVILLEFCSFVF
jgi:hypothetical protein